MARKANDLTQTQKDNVRYYLIGQKVPEEIAYQFLSDIRVYNWKEALMLLANYQRDGYFTEQAMANIRKKYQAKVDKQLAEKVGA